MDKSCVTNTKPTAKRTYSRDELFRLASLMNGLDSLGEILEEHWNYDYARQNEILVGSDHCPVRELDSSPRNFASYGRKKSDLIGINNNIRNLEPEPARYLDQRKFYRMSSSPTIKYNRTPVDNDPTSFNNLPSQVKAKYTRLIESVKNYSNAQSQQTDNSSERSASNESAALSGKPRKPESSSRRHSEDCKKHSEEPMSLPYSINMQATRPSSQTTTTNATSRRPSGAADESLDWRGSSKFNLSMQGEEDDFDLSSLLSITVLSDIRLIRQELNQTHSLKSNQRIAGKLALQRNKSHETTSALRLPPRSRTSIDFNLNETRRANQRLNYEPIGTPYQSTRTQAQHGLAHRASANVDHRQMSMMSFDPYGSLDETASLPYNWQVNSMTSKTSSRGSPALFIDPQVALEQHLKCSRDNKEVATGLASSKNGGTTQAGEKNADRNKIIETFKAQVKARASENSAGVKSAPKTDVSSSAVPVSRAESQEASTGTGTSACKTENRTAVPVSGSPPAGTSSNKDERQAGSSETVTIDRGQKEVVGQRATDIARAPGDSKTDDIGSTEPAPAEKAANSPARASNIPRLISLHLASKQTSKSSADCQSLPAETSSASETKTELARASDRSNIKPGNKFVSKHKGLQSKGLADEVEEST